MEEQAGYFSLWRGSQGPLPNLWRKAHLLLSALLLPGLDLSVNRVTYYCRDREEVQLAVWLQAKEDPGNPVLLLREGLLLFKD